MLTLGQAPAAEIADGWYRQKNDSGVLHADMTPRSVEEGVVNLRGRRRDSADSFYSSPTNSVYTPRRVESIFGVEDAMAYHDRQAMQRPVGGAYFETANLDDNERPVDKDCYGYAESARSFASDSSVSLHFSIPLPNNQKKDGVPTTMPEPTTSTTIPVRTSSKPHSGSTEVSVPSLAVLAASHPPAARYVPSARSSVNRTGRSPLARRSFTRLATDDSNSTTGENIELSDRLSRRHSVAGDERRERRSMSVDRDGRRRLSKPRRGPRAASQD